MPHQLTVPFHGKGSGVDELTWAQRGIWEAMRMGGHSLAIGGVMAMPPGITVDEVVLVLRFAMSRHQSLRTRITFADGQPRQRVTESGEATLELVDAGDENPQQVADALNTRYHTTEFDHVHEWPLRMGAVVRAGELTHVVAVYCHLAIDGYGITALQTDLANLDRATGAENAPVAGVQPLELARHQRTPAARRQSDAALRHWERLLRAVPVVAGADQREPYYRELGGSSPAVYLAARVVAGRNRVETGHVLLAAYATVLATLTGRSQAVAQVLVSNRFRPGFAESVSNLLQPGLVAIDVADSPFDEIVTRAWRASMGASMYGYYDALGQQELYARISRERGADIDISCFYNDRRTQSRQFPAGPPPGRGEIRAALDHGSRELRPQRDWFGGLFFLHINEVADTIDYTMWANAASLSDADLHRCAATFETVIVDAALAG